MGRATVIAVVVLLCTEVARADGLDDAVASLATLGDDCRSGVEHANLLLEVGDLGDDDAAQVESDRSLLELLCPMLDEDATQAQETLAAYRACTGDCDNLYSALYLILGKAQVEGQTVMETMQRLSAIGDGEGVVPSETTDPSQHTILLATIGVSIEVRGRGRSRPVTART